MNELQRLLDEVIRERDELIAEVQRLTEERDEACRYMGETRDLYAADLIVRLKSCRMALDDMTAHAEEFKSEVRRMKAERDDAIEYADCEKQFADGLKAERDEAREAARFFRDVYVSQVGRTYPEEYRLPWEAEK